MKCLVQIETDVPFGAVYVIAGKKRFVMGKTFARDVLKVAVVFIRIKSLQ